MARRRFWGVKYRTGLNSWQFPELYMRYIFDNYIWLVNYYDISYMQEIAVLDRYKSYDKSSKWFT